MVPRAYQKKLAGYAPDLLSKMKSRLELTVVLLATTVSPAGRGGGGLPTFGGGDARRKILTASLTDTTIGLAQVDLKPQEVPVPSKTKTPVGNCFVSFSL